ncbi:uncharacterized protein LOC121785155 [Salvia splendens]|uniref:uncharacterized protein LOC121785155 n=1 Tax=Salvia splendens TaxID=180675 RepID=UPI001C25A1E4|nr:uncharacterized protein LOC121785155 [Salvia splendens]
MDYSLLPLGQNRLILPSSHFSPKLKDTNPSSSLCLCLSAKRRHWVAGVPPAPVPNLLHPSISFPFTNSQIEGKSLNSSPSLLDGTPPLATPNRRRRCRRRSVLVALCRRLHCFSRIRRFLQIVAAPESTPLHPPFRRSALPPPHRSPADLSRLGKILKVRGCVELQSVVSGLPSRNPADSFTRDKFLKLPWFSYCRILVSLFHVFGEL